MLFKSVGVGTRVGVYVVGDHRTLLKGFGVIKTITGTPERPIYTFQLDGTHELCDSVIYWWGLEDTVRRLFKLAEEEA